MNSKEDKRKDEREAKIGRRGDEREKEEKRRQER